MAALQTSPLQDYHLELGAKMAPEAGWSLPVFYPEGTIAEHLHTRSACSVFDACACGIFRIGGLEAVRRFDELSLRPILPLPVGHCMRTLLLTEEGFIRDNPLVLRMAEDDCMVITAPANTVRLGAYLRCKLGDQAQEISALLGKLDLQGPQAAAVLARLEVPEPELPGHYEWRNLEIDKLRCIVSRTGRTGEDGFELLFNREYTDQLWDLLLDTDPVCPAGGGAAETLRLEMGYAAPGHELTDQVTPEECGLESLLHLEDNREFTGRRGLVLHLSRYRLIGVRLATRRAARQGSAVLNGKGEIIGEVTSGAYCPSLESAAALCRIDRDTPVAAGDELNLEAGGGVLLPGQVVELPLYDRAPLRNEWGFL